MVAEIELEPVGTAVVRADFDVVHPSILTASSGGLHFAVSLGGSGSVSLSVDSADGSAASIQVLADVPWLSVPTTATTPVALSVEANTSGLVPGNHSGSLILSSPSHGSLVIPVELEVMGPPPSGAPPIRVELPYILDFESDHGATPDGAGAGTGFTYLDPSTFGGYLPANLRVNHGAGVLEITTTSGLQYVNVNSLHNALGVGFDAPSQVTRIATRLLDPPPGTGKFEQAGL